MKVKDKQRLFSMYNATCASDAKGRIESYEKWLERQLLHRVDKMSEQGFKDPKKIMPDFEHIKNITQFLLSGFYQVGDKRGGNYYIVSRLCDYFDDDTILFDLPYAFVVEGWQEITP